MKESCRHLGNPGCLGMLRARPKWRMGSPLPHRKQWDPTRWPHLLGTGTCSSGEQGSQEAAPVHGLGTESFHPAWGTPRVDGLARPGPSSCPRPTPPGLPKKTRPPPGGNSPVPPTRVPSLPGPSTQIRRRLPVHPPPSGQAVSFPTALSRLRGSPPPSLWVSRQVPPTFSFSVE